MAKGTSQSPECIPEIHVEIEFEGTDKEKTSSISEAVAQASVAVVAQSPAMAEGSLYQIISQATSLSAQNAVNYQKQLTITQQTTTCHDVVKVLFPKTKRSNLSTLKTLQEFITLVKNLQ
jgi:hypothetical protein